MFFMLKKIQVQLTIRQRNNLTWAYLFWTHYGLKLNLLKSNLSFWVEHRKFETFQVATVLSSHL
jgi:hypothetical protein